MSLNQICFSSLRREKGETKWEAFVDYPFAYKFGTTSPEKRKWQAQEERYLKWIANESAWSKAFITKSPTIMAKYGILYDVRYCAKFVCQAATFPRYLAEFPLFIRRWNFFKKHVDGHIALHLAQDTYFEKDRFTFEEDHTPNSNHQGWRSGEIGPVEMKRMLKKRMKMTNRYPPMSDDSDYSEMNTIWGSRSGREAKYRFDWPAGQTKEIKTHFGNTINATYYPKSDIKSFIHEFLTLNELDK